MKIAIQISGFIRTFKHIKKSLLEQLLHEKSNEYYFFIHVYRQNQYEFSTTLNDHLISDDEFNELFDGLNIASIIIEDRDEIFDKIFNESLCIKHASNYYLEQQESGDKNSKNVPIGFRTYDHLRKIYLCNKLRLDYESKHDTSFDLVVKTRFDLCYFSKIDWSKCLNNDINVEYGATFGWPNDTFAVCRPDIMDKYTSRFVDLVEMIDNNEVSGICAHQSLGYVMKKYNISINNYRIINTNCIRSRDCMQFYGNYKQKIDIEDLYTKLSSLNSYNPYLVEEHKKKMLN